MVGKQYDASSIIVLEGLEAVRKRPGMYIGNTGKQGLHHLVWEVVDNAVDEALAGYCDSIIVTLHQDGSVSVSDNGRGLPVDMHPTQKRPAVEVIFTLLHAGGKFDPDSYAVSGGLHGVGVTVVNAMSDWTRARVKRDGKVWEIAFGTVERRNGKPTYGAVTSALRQVGKCSKSDTGSTVSFMPAADAFHKIEWDSDMIRSRLRNTAFLNPGITISFIDERTGGAATDTFHYPNGLSDFMDMLVADRAEAYAAKRNVPLDDVRPLLHNAVLLRGDQDRVGSWELCLQWTQDTAPLFASFANSIETTDGGTHVDGFTRVFTGMVNKYCRQEHIGLLGAKDPNLTGQDIQSGMVAIVSIKAGDLEFQGQTKGRLTSDKVGAMVRAGFLEKMYTWMEEHPAEFRVVMDKVIGEMRLRLRLQDQADRERAGQEKRGSGAGVSLPPSNLRDCETKNRLDAELFLVEGKSAGGSAQDARDRKTQAVLPLRGKPLNVVPGSAWKEDVKKLRPVDKNAEIQDVINAVGAGSEDFFEVTKSRYGKVVILADADDDGRHIQCLLMGMFMKLMRPLVEDGRLYVARTPLFSTVVRGTKHFVYSAAERQRFESDAGRRYEWQRFKGLGEMNADELREAAFDVRVRRLERIFTEDADTALSALDALLGDDASTKWDAVSAVEMNAADVLL